MKIKIDGMSCGKCKARIEEGLLSMDSIDSAMATVETGEVEVQGSIDLESLKEAIDDLGFDFVEEL